MGGAHLIRAERQEKAAAEIVAERDRPQQLRARAVLALGHRERGRHDGAAGMRLGDRLEIVGFVGVAEHPVGERGVDRRRSDVGREDGRLRHAALSAHVLDRHLAGLEAGPRHHRRQRVEDAMLGFAHDLGRQTPIARLDHVARQPAGDIRTRRRRRGGGGLTAIRRRIRGGWKRRSRHESARTLQPAAPGQLLIFHVFPQLKVTDTRHTTGHMCQA